MVQFPTTLAMHIPDGFLSLPVSVVGYMLAGLMLMMAVLRVRQQKGSHRVPMVGVLAGVIFAAQMLNYPVIGGTSGHLIGGALAAVLLGPWSAMLTITSVLVIQSFVFHDGGLLTLGFNILNMAVLSVFVGYSVYWACVRLFGRQRGLFVGVTFGAWVSVVVAAAAAAVELAASGMVPLGMALPAMVGIHAVIGLGEAFLTFGALMFIDRTKRELLDEAALPERSSHWIGAGLLIALALALVSPLASALPDGLESVALDYGFAGQSQSLLPGLLPDYTVPFIANPALTTAAAGMAGVLLVSLAGFGMMRLLRRPARNESGL